MFTFLEYTYYILLKYLHLKVIIIHKPSRITNHIAIITSNIIMPKVFLIYEHHGTNTIHQLWKLNILDPSANLPSPIPNSLQTIPSFFYDKITLILQWEQSRKPIHERNVLNPKILPKTCSGTVTYVVRHVWMQNNSIIMKIINRINNSIPNPFYFARRVTSSSNMYESHE